MPIKKTKKHNHKRNKSIKSIKKGGLPIASGGFGCVFKPALLCKNSTIRPQNHISKLMGKKYALKEKNEIDLLHKPLSTINNYQKYFMIDNITLCEPMPLTSEDMKGYQKTCFSLERANITAENINNNLSKLLMITMPDGGIPVDEFLKQYANKNKAYFYQLNKSLINLLKNGIIRMNEKDVYHNDIKDSNILVEKVNDKIYTRIIDWGLACIYKPTYNNNKLPSVWINRPFQYNIPYSSILFSDTFSKVSAEFYSSNPDPDHLEIKSLVSRFVSQHIDNYGMGHLQLINKIINIVYDDMLNKESIDKILKNNTKYISQTTQEVITGYISEILLNYRSLTIYNTFDITDYIDNVYIFNVDQWGFVMVYYPILELLYSHYPTLDKDQQFIYHTIRDLFLYIIETPELPINEMTIEKHLKKIDKMDINPFNSLDVSVIDSSKGITGSTIDPASASNSMVVSTVDNI